MMRRTATIQPSPRERWRDGGTPCSARNSGEWLRIKSLFDIVNVLSEPAGCEEAR
jgi:hypothetical protein